MPSLDIPPILLVDCPLDFHSLVIMTSSEIGSFDCDSAVQDEPPASLSSVRSQRPHYPVMNHCELYRHVCRKLCLKIIYRSPIHSSYRSASKISNNAMYEIQAVAFL